MDTADLRELLQARLAELGCDTDGDADFTDELQRARAYIFDFCDVSDLTEDLAPICVELAAAAILRREACRRGDGAQESVERVSMGDVAICYGADSVPGRLWELADSLWHNGISLLASRRGVRW